MERDPEQGRSTLAVSGSPEGGLTGVADRMPLAPGSLIKHYEIVRELGQGGMGRVFLARDTRLARLCAIKLLLEYTGDGAGRFLAEARVTARCKHESIVIIYEVDEIRGHPYMVLEYLEGRTLRAWMTGRDRREPAPPSLAIELVLPVVRALACAHEMGIVHRDLKPENIFLTEVGQVKVLDFGIAKRIAVDEVARPIDSARERHAEDAGLTRQGTLLGTLPYMSPEQWLGREIGPETDIWALGIILYELVTGSHPLAPATMARLREVQDLALPMPSVHERRPDVGPLGAVIDRCLKKHRAERIGSARELLAELEPLVSGRSASGSIEEESPFAGLSAFQESDAERFFGRDRDVAALLSRLRNQQLVAVAGPSGAGKSSFVRAGVIPALKRQEGAWEAFTLRPGRRPLAALAGVLVHAGDDTEPGELAAVLRDKPGYLGAELRARCRRLSGDHRILLFVDQFEELYTLGIDAAERTAFLTCLEGVADDASSPLRLVLAVRSDFLDRIADDRHFMIEVARGLVFLPPIGRDGLRDALTRPIEAASYRYEGDELVEQMLDALQRTPCPLPLLQFAATRLWEARDRDRRLLSRDSYHALGGIAGALSTHADAVLSALSIPEQRLARAILLRLVTPERTRAIVSMAELRELGGGGDAEQVVQHLAGARLLLIELGGVGEGSTVQLVHESLIDRWAKLRQWLDENEQDVQFLARLRAAAQPWKESGELDGLLWRDHAAEEARQWLERRRAVHGAEPSSGLGKHEERYLLAVVALAERARRVRRRAVTGVIAALGAIGIAVSYLAIRASQEAERAQTEARQSRNATRMATARELASDPTTVLALLREIEPPDVPRGWSQLARRALQDGVTRMVLVHSRPITSAAFSPDGAYIVTSSGDKTARVWRADGTGEPLVLRGHQDSVFSAAWSPDGKRIATASADGTARVWSADGTGELLVLRVHGEWLRSVAWSPDGMRIVAAAFDGTARVWSADGTGEPLVLRVAPTAITSAAFSPDGRQIVTASADHIVRVWSADGSGEPLVLRGHEGVVWSAAWSPDGKRIVTASADKTERVWSADGTGEPLVLRGHPNGLTWAAFSPDGKHIVTASDDKMARVWSADGTGEPLVLRGHEHGLLTAAFSPDGKRIVTASVDRTARVWSADGEGKAQVFRGHEEEVFSAAFSPDGRRIVTASLDRTARVWSADGTGDALILRGHAQGLTWAAFSPDGKRIVTASDDKTARVWNADGTGEALILRGHGASLLSAAWSPDGTRIVTAAGDDKTVRVWSADGLGEPLGLEGHEQVVASAAFSPDGKRIVTASADKTVRVWSADGTGATLVLRHPEPVASAAFSPDGERIVTACADKTARVWSADGRGEPLILRGHEEGVRSAAFSPDGKRIVTASSDRTVRVWNADGTGEPLILSGAERGYSSAAWSPDGKRIVASSDDKTVWVWTDLEPLTGVDDPALWSATTYCMSIERRIALLGVSEVTARAQDEACARRVEQARSHR